MVKVVVVVENSKHMEEEAMEMVVVETDKCKEEEKMEGVVSYKCRAMEGYCRKGGDLYGDDDHDDALFVV